MIEEKDYPIISVFVHEVQQLSKEQNRNQQDIIADTTLELSAYSRISSKTRKKSLDFAHELIKYFSPHLLMHHFQDEVPVFTLYLGVNEHEVNINTHGGYYSKFIHNISALQNILDELIVLSREDLNISDYNIEDIVMELESMPRLDMKYDRYKDSVKERDEYEYLDWSYTRILRTPYSEQYILYLNDENAGEFHIHIGKNINATIITTADITEKEKAELMGYIHETILESLEEEHGTNSTMRFYCEALEDI